MNKQKYNFGIINNIYGICLDISVHIADILYNIVKDRSIKKVIAREAATQIGMPPPHFPQQEQMVFRCNVLLNTVTIHNLLTTKIFFTQTAN